jgi:hypothetical protein
VVKGPEAADRNRTRTAAFHAKARPRSRHLTTVRVGLIVSLNALRQRGAVQLRRGPVEVRAELGVRVGVGAINSCCQEYL